MGFKVTDFRDTDLLWKLAQQGASGVEARELAQELGASEDGAHGVGSRLAWMRRYGMVAYDEKKKLWTPTQAAERVLASTVRASRMQAIESIPDEQMVEVMAHVTSRYRLGDPMTAALLRREFQYGTSPRR